MTGEHRTAGKRPLHQRALEAYLRGELHLIGRANTRRPEADYEQDLAQAVPYRVTPAVPVSSGTGTPKEQA